MHNNRPRSLCVALRGAIIKPPKPPILIINFEHLKHLASGVLALLLSKKLWTSIRPYPLGDSRQIPGRGGMYLSSSSFIAQTLCNNSCTACEIRLQFFLFRVGFFMCYKTNRSSGRGTEVTQNLQKLRVGSMALYPVPVPTPRYFHRPHRSPG